MSVHVQPDHRRDVVLVAVQLFLVVALLGSVGAGGWCLYLCSRVGPVARAVQEAEDDAVRREYLTRQNEVAHQQEDMSQLQGAWVLAAGEESGKALPTDRLRGAHLQVSGDEHLAVVGEETFKGSHLLEPTRSPRAIDTTDEAGPLSGGTALGIYTLDGDVFKVCFAAPGEPRPQAFTTRSGTGRTLLVWKRRPAQD